MRCLRVLAAATLLAFAASAGGASAQAPSEPAPNDYVYPSTWLCRPDIHPNACDVNLTATVVAADGSTRIQQFKASPDAPIDCFYVYPTVSRDPGVLATMKAEPAELNVVKQQFARLGSSCRLYAPLYRQFTLTALQAAMQGHPLTGSTGPDLRTPYDDVRDAWAWYLANANHGRGVVLVGHSQGSLLLTDLIRKEIDGKADQKRFVSAILMGTNLVVPKGSDVGGDFKSIALCHAADQVGCVIAYASFRETSPPPPDSLFGLPDAPAPGMAAACVNPASLAGGAGALEPYFPVNGPSVTLSATPQITWARGKTLTTPFVTLPGLLSATCVSTPQFNYLSIRVNADASGVRTHTIPEDVNVDGHILRNWGLHLIDANLAMGNLAEIVQAEGEAWVKRRH